MIIPPRTKINIRMAGSNSFPEDTKEIIIPLTVEQAEYECYDCGFKGTFEAMIEHQGHQKEHHTLRQRVMRWLDSQIFWIFR